VTPAAAATPYVYAVISVNGISEGVALHGPFPAATPIFTLAAIGSNWVKFSLVTGGFATGAKELTLTKGKSVTLRNTADGSRYVVRLVTTSQAVPTTTGSASTDVVQTTPDSSLTATGTDGTTTTPPPPTTPGP
jgi:hypothetical protein